MTSAIGKQPVIKRAVAGTRADEPDVYVYSSGGLLAEEMVFTAYYRSRGIRKQAAFSKLST